jgi:hypothetical protein
MGRNIRRKQEFLRQRTRGYDERLAAAPARVGPDMAAIRASVLDGLSDRAVRDPATWPCALRTRDPGRIALDFARHAFASYPVPHHLERIWLGGERLSASETSLRKAWYLSVAQGRSLHKEHTGTFLTKRETHRFLAPPVRMGFREALWYAVARTHSDDHGACLRVAASKVARPVVTPFWKDAARFFAGAGIPLNEIDDLVDYLAHRVGQSAAFALKGRTLASLRTGMHDWHRDLARRAKVEGGKWDGHDVEGYRFVEEAERPGRDVTWTVVQVLTGNDLAEEGSRQRHCVASYKANCMSGTCSIWSLRRTDWKSTERVLTMEMRHVRRIVQIRGFANRLATPEEMRHVRRWAAERRIEVPGH